MSTAPDWANRWVAIDSSIMVGVLNTSDHRHVQAKRLVDDLQLAEATLIYFDCVIAESVSTLLRRLHEKQQFTAIQQLLDAATDSFPPERLTWIMPDTPRLYAQILALIESSLGELNFNDALIALACRERGISMLASFDTDFDDIEWLQRIERINDEPVTK